MKKRFSTILLFLILFIGLSLLLYPSFSDYWNSLHQTRAIADYTEIVSKMGEDAYLSVWNDAETYNRYLMTVPNPLQPTEEDYAYYESVLDITGNGIMGYINIPSINCSYPLYHGTEESVLQVAIGHIAGTSLPTGGMGTHVVVSGHRGLPSARLFTDLDKLTEGDLIVFTVLDRTLTYEVHKIQTVLPYEVASLAIDPEQDLCTLVTCTPYGINTHRLLIHAHRVDNLEEEKIIRVTADAIQIEPVVIAPLVAMPLLFLLFIGLITSTGKRKK